MVKESEKEYHEDLKNKVIRKDKEDDIEEIVRVVNKAIDDNRKFFDELSD